MSMEHDESAVAAIAEKAAAKAAANTAANTATNAASVTQQPAAGAALANAAIRCRALKAQRCRVTADNRFSDDRVSSEAPTPRLPATATDRYAMDRTSRWLPRKRAVNPARIKTTLLALLLVSSLPTPSYADESAESTVQPSLLDVFDIRGNIGIDATVFTANPLHSASQQSNLSVSGEVEFYKAFGEGDKSLVITPFLRIDEHDSERTHFDFRELLYQHAIGDWEFKAGLGKVFWGVAESYNPVDVINQTDQVENLTTNEKLGQPMIQASWAGQTSELEVFVLPGFRERTYPGRNGRPRLPLPVDTDAAEFESDDKARHIGAAFRYIYLFDEWDVGFSYFNGTARDPLLRPDASGESLIPFYYLVSQVGFDVQATLESWLLKLELVHQSGDEIENHVRGVSGFEYSFYGVGETDTDIGIVLEYLYDERGDDATQPLQNDVLAGVRIALNDEQSTEALIGILADLDGDGMSFSAEASRRIGDDYKLTLEATTWFDSDPDGQQAAIDREDNINIRFARFF